MSTKLTPALIKRAKKILPSYLENTLRYCFTDCCDSMRSSESTEEWFNGAVDDTISITAFIEEYALAEYAKAWDEMRKECDLSVEDAANPGVCALPIPYERFKHLVQS